MIAIIGAGISGLTLAYELQKAGKSYILFESDSRPGGYIRSQQVGNYLLEIGPNSILLDAAFESFLNEIGLQNEITFAAAVNKNRFIYKKGSVQKVPSGPASLLFSDFFSLKTKKAILTEAFRKSETKDEETIYDFFSRRFSKELTDLVVDPFTTGVYAGDTKQLLIEDTFPALYAFEQKHGSIIKGVFKEGFGGRRKTASFKNGLQTLSDKIASTLTSIEYNKKVTNINTTQEDIQLEIHDQHSQLTETRKVTKVIFCGTTFHASEILKASFPDVADTLNQVNYAPVKALYAAFKKTDVKNPMQGFGVLYPSVENSFLAGTIWNSSIFSNRCPKDEILTTSFIGGMKHPEYTRLNDEELKERSINQLKKDLQISGNPTFVYSAGWNKGIPQYDLALRKARNAVNNLKDKKIFFTSNWTNSIALGNCIQNARQLALEL